MIHSLSLARACNPFLLSFCPSGLASKKGKKEETDSCLESNLSSVE